MISKRCPGPMSVRACLRALGDGHNSRNQVILVWAERLEERRLLALVPPALHSDQSASKILYLDFVGTPAFTFTANAAANSPYTAHGAGSNTTPIPAFTTLMSAAPVLGGGQAGAGNQPSHRPASAESHSQAGVSSFVPSVFSSAKSITFEAKADSIEATLTKKDLLDTLV